MESKALRTVFPIFLGILLALLIGFGVQVFYPEPDAAFRAAGPGVSYDSYTAAMEAYSRVASTVISALGIVPLIIGSILPRRAAVLADGFLLGGVFTLLYAAVRGSGSGSGMGAAPSFLAVGAGLVLALGALFVRQSGRPLGRRGPTRAPSEADDATLAVVFPLAGAPLAATVVALGLETLYPSPALPGYVASDFPVVLAEYGRNSGLIVTVLAVLLIAAGFALRSSASIPADALILGGLIALVEGSARAMSAKTSVVSFAVGVLSFLVALAAGHLRLVGWAWRGAATPAQARPGAGARMFAVAHPLAAGALSVTVFYVGISAFYPEPGTDVPAPQWLRTVSLSATATAVVFLVVSLLLERISSASANALVVSGLFTLVAGVTPAAMAGEQALVFLALAVSVAVVLFVGYRRFVRRGGRPKAPPGRPPAVPPAPPAPAA